MHLLLTDRLTCPRCGPEFGLILLADRLVDRRVHDGRLGCPNCRDAFPVHDGFADLRAPPRGALPPGLAGADPGQGEPAEEPGDDPATVGAGGVPDDEGERVIALLGIPRGPGTVALVGRPARHAGLLVDSIGEIDVAAVDSDAAAWAERAGVSRLVAAPGLPFFSRTLRGVVLDGRLGDAMLFEAARVTAPRSRVVVVSAPTGALEVLREAGLEVLAAEAGTVVAARG